MKHDLLSRTLIGAAGVLLAGAATFASAAGPRAPAGDATLVVTDFSKITGKTLTTTSFEGDSQRYTLNPGFTNIGVPITFKCTAACTVAVNTMVQVEEQSTFWAICPVIDGNDAIQSCNWQGLAATSSGLYVTGNGTYFWTLAAGKHTLQAQVYLDVAGALDNWSLTLSQYQ